MTTPLPPAAARPAVPQLGKGETWLLYVVATLAIGVGGLGLASSFQTVTAAGARWGFSTPQILPIGIDTAIPVFTAVRLLLIRMDMPLAWVRWIPWGLTLVTCWLNVAAGHSLSAKVAHGTMPLLWVGLSEVAAHVYASRIGAVTGRRMESIRKSRWLLAFPSTFALWRRMTLWEITSYHDALNRERERQLARADLREEHGWRWRSKTPRRHRVLLRLGELTPADTTPSALGTNQEETRPTTVNQSGSDLPVSTPAPEALTTDQTTPDAVDPSPVPEPTAESIPAPPIDPQPEPSPAPESTPEPDPEPAATRAPKSGPRRSTGRVPTVARSARPKRTPEQLLTEAREVTADWPDDALTGEAIRKALRTAPDKARALRDTLKAERAEAADAAPVAA
ncbi:DUF2637 domain-containing protein [Streptomyces sp. SL13]|uniref:DUF2637 domain-containing protein n=1 Tax=Streptantibioticus silvisoli TaxID=2705255 RepID=A0AA90KA14_9ACTN|nr:DUF2637 domain-containing protein [Streptantibioticus silvisoli]MDI5971517.1 DUF2637 domain-containing protein [Streptantibioticus silvisoli]